MSRKKASKVDFRSPDVERLQKYYGRFFKGTFYQKILAGNSHIQFNYGYSDAPKPYPLTFHEELELIYVRQGRGAYYLAGKTYHFQKRLLLITKPNEIHSIMSVPLKEKVESGCLVFPLGWLGMDLNITSWPHAVLLVESEAARFDLICGQVSEEVKKQESGYEDMIKAKFQEICCLVRRIVSQPKKERANPLGDQLRDYIDQHFTEKTSVLNICKHFGYTERHLEGIFKKIMGLSLKRYILSRRIMEARILMEANPEITLAAIAERIGFENYEMFYRIFKMLSGVNPEAYRHVIHKAAAKKGVADYHPI